MWLNLLTGCIPVLHSPEGAVSGDYTIPENAWPAAESVPADKFKDDGFVYVTVLSENLDGDVPVVEELVGWSESFGILDQPILSDTTGFSAPITNGQYPALLVIDRDLTVFARVDVPDEALLEAAIESAL